MSETRFAVGDKINPSAQSESTRLMKEFQNECWDVGYFMDLPQYRQWTDVMKDEAREREGRRIFAKQSFLDEGKGRIFLMECSSSEEAKDIVEKHNNEKEVKT